MSVAKATPTTHSRSTSMPRDWWSVFLHVTGNCKMAAPQHCTKTWKRQLVTLDHEATFVEAWHAPFQTTRQNCCLHGFRKCRGALVLHLVEFEIEDLQGGVGLAMFNSSDHTTQQTPVACCHTTLHQRGQNSTHSECHVRMRIMGVRRRDLFVCTRTCLLNLRPKSPR